ncbi:MAG: hypothetical protein KBT20_04295 [Bacteroidales bacterium]|nr:hypothetical protein [Candidatus Liminaster caballi]
MVDHKKYIELCAGFGQEYYTHYIISISMLRKVEHKYVEWTINNGYKDGDYYYSFRSYFIVDLLLCLNYLGIDPVVEFEEEKMLPFKYFLSNIKQDTFSPSENYLNEKREYLYNYVQGICDSEIYRSKINDKSYSLYIPSFYSSYELYMRNEMYYKELFSFSQLVSSACNYSCNIGRFKLFLKNKIAYFSNCEDEQFWN